MASYPSPLPLILALLAVVSSPAPAAPNAALPAGDSIERGEYIAHLGDCAACNTAQAGRPMAGGLGLATPFGIVHSTNITPDVNTGIGRYSFEQFDRAVRGGVAADGHNLYPVMPYTSFAKVNQRDMRALYAYFMRGVAPVSQANLDNDLRWPFSMRFGLSAWNAIFADGDEFKADPAKSAGWNRGAYIIEGPGHCGACHTPRGVAFQEKATSHEGSAGNFYLAGATVDAWHAPALRDLWSPPDIARFLKTGRNVHAAAYGSMAEVVHFSTQQFSDEDLAAMAEYLSSLSTRAAASPAAAKAEPDDRRTAEDLYTTRGGLGYVQFCSACHRLDGRGVDDFFPPLAQNRSVLSADPTSVIHVVLSGGKTAETHAYPRAFAMPNFSSLSDPELAEIITFLRSRWGNRGDGVSPEAIRAVRDEIALKPDAPANFAVPRFAAMLESRNADQLIYGMRLMTETKHLLPDSVGNDLACASCHLNGGTVAKASPFVGISALFPLYAPRAGKTIDFKDRLNACFKRSMNGKALDKNSRELQAMVAYVDWMKTNTKPNEPIPGRGVGKLSDALVPDANHGKLIYQNQCAVCHGSNGEGVKQADGAQVFPPLWGDASFNIGAGMGRTYTAAGFVKNNMPMANTLKFPMGQGGLTDQEAVDVAEYFTHMERPDFPDKIKDWPSGGKPSDARY